MEINVNIRWLSAWFLEDCGRIAQKAEVLRIKVIPIKDKQKRISPLHK